MKIKHIDLDLPLIHIAIIHYRNAQDKAFFCKVLDDIYNLIFEDLYVRDLILIKNDTREDISFYTDKTIESKMKLRLIAEQIKIILETEPKVHAMFTYTYKESIYELIETFTKPVTDTTKQKQSEAHKGKHHSPETIQKIRESKLGKHHTDETKQKMSEAHKGQIPWHKGLNVGPRTGQTVSDETKQKLSKAHHGHRKGVKLSEETKEKMRQAKLGKTLSYEHKMKIGAAHAGKVVSEETKQKMSEAHKGLEFTEEHKRRIAEGHTGLKYYKNTIE